MKKLIFFEALKLWYARNFQIITLTQAKEWKLTFVRNVFGDEINNLSNSTHLCRSIWEDEKGRTYRVSNLYYGSKALFAEVDPSTDSNS
jgi:hypothetical protein